MLTAPVLSLLLAAAPQDAPPPSESEAWVEPQELKVACMDAGQTFLVAGQKFKEGAVAVGQAVKEGGVAVGQAAATAGRKVGQGATKVGLSVKKRAKKLGEGVKGAFGPEQE